MVNVMSKSTSCFHACVHVTHTQNSMASQQGLPARDMLWLRNHWVRTNWQIVVSSFGYSIPKPSALEIAIVSFCLRTFRFLYGGRQSWLKHVWDIGNMLVLWATSMRIILNSISPMPPIGTRSLPVANRSSFFFSSRENDRTTSQKYLMTGSFFV